MGFNRLWTYAEGTTLPYECNAIADHAKSGVPANWVS